MLLSSPLPSSPVSALILFDDTWQWITALANSTTRAELQSADHGQQNVVAVLTSRAGIIILLGRINHIWRYR